MIVKKVPGIPQYREGESLILEVSYTVDRYDEYEIDQIVDTEDGTDVTVLFFDNDWVIEAIEDDMLDIGPDPDEKYDERREERYGNY
jgi:hypothetical protein